MRVLIVEPRYYTADVQAYFPVGPAYVAASLAAGGHSVEALDANLLRGTAADVVAQVRKRIEDSDTELLAMGGLCTTFDFQELLFRSVREAFPDLVLVCGGNLFSSEPELCFEHFGLDFGVLGEADETMVSLCDVLSNGGNPADVPGLLLRRLGRVTRAGPPVAPEDLDALPFPAWELFADPGRIRSRGFMPVFTSRGCPFRCTFCYHPEGSSYRRRTVASVIEEIDLLQARYGIGHVALCDELFGTDRAWTLRFCDALEARKPELTWECQMRAPDASRGLLARMKAAGCVKLSMGIESGSDRVLRSMRKGFTATQSARAIAHAREAGLPATGGIILGDFAETADTVRETIRFIQQHKLVPVSDVGMVVPYPGSAIYTRCLEEERIRDRLTFIRSLGAYDKLRVNMTALPDAQLLGLQEAASQEVYAHFLASCRGDVVDVLSCGVEASVLLCTCPACGARNEVEVVGTRFEIQGWCRHCRVPLYLHPLDVPHIERASRSFRERVRCLHAAGDGRFLVTPVGHDFLRLTAAFPVPESSIAGFLDASPNRQRHPFLGRPVFERTAGVLREMRPTALLVVSAAYQDAIVEEVASWNLPDVEILPFADRDRARSDP